MNPYYVNKGNVPVEFGESLCIEIDETTTPPLTPPVFENERDGKELPKVTLVKTETVAQGGGKLEGAVITLTGQDKGNKYVGRTSGEGAIESWYSGETYPTDPNAKPVDNIVSDKYTLTETTYPKGYTNLNLSEFNYHNSITEADAEIKVTNEKILVDLTITNACGQGESTYEILDANDNRVTQDVLDKLLSKYTTVKAYDGNTEIQLPNGKVIVDAEGLITMPAGADKIVLEDLHLAAGKYSINQLTPSDDCLLEDNPGTFDVPEDPNPEITVDETDKPIYGVTLTFKNCAQEDVAGTYTLTGTTGDAAGKSYTVDYTVTDGNTKTVIKDGKEVVDRILTGDYKVTGEGMVERTISITSDSNNVHTIATQDCGEIEIEFDRCDKFASQGIAVYKSDASGNVAEGATPVFIEKNLSFDPGKPITVTKDSLPVGNYVVVALDKDGNANFNVKEYFKVDSQSSSKTITLVEPCGNVKQEIMFDKCDRTTTSTVDVYSVTINPDGTIVTTIYPSGEDLPVVNGKAEIDLPEGSYIIVPGNSSIPTNPTIITVTEQTETLSTITVTENCDEIVVNIEFDRCEKNGIEKVDIFKGQDLVVTVALTEVNGLWKGVQNLPEGTYSVKDHTTQKQLAMFEITEDKFIHNGNEVALDSNNTVTLNIVEPCDAVSVDITVKSCDKLGNTMVDVYEVNSNNEIIPETKQSVLVVDGKANVSLTEGSYVFVPSGTTTFDKIYTIDETTTGPIPVTVTQDCNEATITFKSCDAPISNTTYEFDDKKGNKFTVTTDVDGKISTTVPPGVYTVTNTTTNVSKVVDITSDVSNLVIVECEACTANVTVPELNNQTVTISNGTIIETVIADSTGKFTVPFTDGTLTVKDSAGKVVGNITVADCKGEFSYPACENPTIALPNHGNQNVYILSQDEVGGVITSPDTTTIDVATITTSPDTVTVDTDGKLVIDKSKLTESLEYYIVDSSGNILKIIKLDSNEIVVYTTSRDEEARIEECVPKNPIPFEPSVPLTPLEPSIPVTPPGGGNEGTPPTTPGGGNEGTPPTTPGPGINPGPGTNPGTGITPDPAKQLPPHIVNEINALNDLILGYPSELPTAEELDRLLGLYKDYLKMTPEQKRAFEKLVDIKALKDLLLGEGVKLPQTDGNLNTTTTLFGLALLAMAAMLIVRRRKTAK